jgi:hypothetical protein
MNAKTYNYSDFTPDNYDLKNPAGLRAGDTLPDITLSTLDGDEASLSKYKGKFLVIETGSLSCPLYIGKIKSMNEVARAFPDVEFIVVYIREAHPGTKLPSHETQASKATNAKRLQTAEPENRTILIDNLNGDFHTQLGLLPNMAYVISSDQKVVYRADWNIPTRITEVLNAAKAGNPVPTEPANFTPVPPHYSVRVLYRAGGFRAVWDFISHLPELIKRHRETRK